MGTGQPKAPQPKQNLAPATAMKKINKPPEPKKQKQPQQAMAKHMPVPQKPMVAKDHVVSVEKPKTRALHAPNKQKVQKNIFSTKEVFKNMAVANRKIPASSIMPVSDITPPVQELQMNPSVEPQMESYAGETPFLPFDQNGSGTDIQSFLGYELYVYEDPLDHVHYFRLSIKVEEIPGTLVTLPKEMEFLIDASGSIGQDALEQVKTAISKAMHELDSNDKFNIAVFNQGVRKMQAQSIDATSPNIRQAERFLEDVRAVAKTDIYDSVLKAVRSPHRMKPAYILLISDGQPTQGVTDSLQLINKIGEINQGRVPIFGLGLGWSNEYLMNFMAFTNHGWSEFVSLNAEDSIVQMYDHIKDPVLTSLRYNSVGLNTEEIYPKMLPDLFKGSNFVLYGTFTGEKDFMLRLLGDSLTDTKQYIIKDSLANGLPGDRTIAQEWAMRKIYHLIGKLQYDRNNQGIIDEVNGLASKFDLKIPEYTVNPKA